MFLKSMFSAIGRVLKGAFSYAQETGVTDVLLYQAKALVRRAEVELVNNDTRREWVVTRLKAVRVPEAVARIATEMAVQAMKRDLAKAR